MGGGCNTGRARTPRRARGISALVILIVALAAMAVGASAATADTKFYVSPSGHDNWPGTKQRPFETLRRAQQAVRQATHWMHSDVVVNLRAGTHVLDQPLRLSDAKGDSGRHGNKVVYQAYGYGTRREENAIVSGGRRITGWKRVAGQPGVWRAPVGDLVTRHLFVNGERASMSALGGGLPGTLEGTKTGYVTDSTDPQSWDNPGEIELVYTGAFSWSEPRCGIDEISGDANSTTITMDQPCFEWSQKMFATEWEGTYYPLIDPTAVQNSSSFLNDPGEFYLDRSQPGQHVLMYVPRPGEDMRRANVIAPTLETLVESRGKPGNRLHDVVFRGLTFAHATWLAPSEPAGFVHYWAHTYYNGGEVNMATGDFPTNEDLLSVPGNLSFHGVDRIDFEDDRFVKLGAAAVEFSHDSGYNSVVGSVFTDVSGGGVWMGPSAPETGGPNPGNRIENNWVHDIGVEFPGSAGLLLQGTQDSVIAHNQVNDVPYSGIVLAHSGDLDNAGPATTGQKVLNNYVFDALKRLSDGGGIYISGPQGSTYGDGALIRGNVVHDVPYLGIYADFYATWETIRENVTYRTTYSSGGYCPIIVNYEGNFWDNENVAYAGECPPPWPEVTYKDNTLLPETDPAGACAAITACKGILTKAGLEREYRHLLLGDE